MTTRGVIFKPGWREKKLDSKSHFPPVGERRRDDLGASLPPARRGDRGAKPPESRGAAAHVGCCVLCVVCARNRTIPIL